MHQIREAKSLDREDIRKVHLSAFPEEEREPVAALAVDLLDETTTPETFALVAEVDGELVGHIGFSPCTIEGDGNWSGYILAPLGVKPGFQQQGIGKVLIETGKALLSQRGVNLLFVYGDPAYYGRFGFEADTASAYLPPYELQYPFGWQAIMLNDDGAGEARRKLSCVASLRDPDLW